MKKKYQYILFDLDGTLTDPKVGITSAVAYALKSFEIMVEDLDILCPFIGPPLKISFMEFYKLSNADAEKAVEKYREYFSETGIFENFVYDKIEKLLIRLKADNKTLVLATSKPRIFAERILDHFQLTTYFDTIAGSEMDGIRGEKGEVIQYALEQYQIEDRESVVMVGDRKFDIIGAKENGIASIGVLYGYGDREELELAGADFILETVEELDVFLENK